MIVTVTPNPSIDRTLSIPRLARGELVRAERASAEAGGKGINIARVLRTHGVPAIAIAPLSPASAASVAGLLAGSATLDWVPIHGEVRVNVSLVEPDGAVTKVNEPGPGMSEPEWTALLAKAVAVASESSATWVVGSGSLPPGAPIDFYARLGRALPRDVRFAVDADGAALEAGIAGGPDLIKPNHIELERLVGRRLPTLGAVISAARGVVERGVRAVLASLGPDGAVLVDAGATSHAEARLDDIMNTVGAGDALLAGFLAAGADHDALRDAVAWSVAACRSPGTQVRPVEASDIAAVFVHRRIEAARALTGSGRVRQGEAVSA